MSSKQVAASGGRPRFGWLSMVHVRLTISRCQRSRVAGVKTGQTRERSGSLAAMAASATFSQREGRGSEAWRS
jgi:hypothetical protein